MIFLEYLDGLDAALSSFFSMADNRTHELYVILLCVSLWLKGDGTPCPYKGDNKPRGFGVFEAYCLMG